MGTETELERVPYKALGRTRTSCPLLISAPSDRYPPTPSDTLAVLRRLEQYDDEHDENVWMVRGRGREQLNRAEHAAGNIMVFITLREGTSGSLVCASVILARDVGLRSETQAESTGTSSLASPINDARASLWHSSRTYVHRLVSPSYHA